MWKQHDVAFSKCNLREEARIKLDNLVPMLSLPRRSHPSPPPRIENLRISISSGLGKILNSTSDNLLGGTMNTLKSEFLEEFIRLGPWDSSSWVKRNWLEVEKRLSIVVLLPFSVLPSCQNGWLLESTSKTQNIYTFLFFSSFSFPQFPTPPHNVNWFISSS